MTSLSRTRLAAAFAALLSAAPVASQDAGIPPELNASRQLREVAGSLAPLAETGSGITRDAGGIAVIEHDGSNYDRTLAGGTLNYAARAAVALRFYQSHPDDYDFLVVFTSFDFNTDGALAFH